MAKIIHIELDARFKGESSYENMDGVIITLDDGLQIKFGISDGQSCCESWAYLHSVDDIESFIGAEYLDLVEKDTWPDSIDDPEYGFDSGGFQAIDVNTSNGTMQFVVYNSHNGYYSHATILVVGDTVKSDYL